MHESLASRDAVERARLDRLIRALRDKRSSNTDESSGEFPRPADAEQTTARLLSAAQQRLWFLNQLHPGRATYNMPAVLILDGPLDRQALAWALDDVRGRHESLRAEIDDGGANAQQPTQRVLPARPRALPIVDFGAFPPQRGARLAQQFANREAQRAFDLTRGPLFRTNLLRLAAGRHHLVAVLHHIIADGWSIEVLLRDLEQAYAARRQERAPDWTVLIARYDALDPRQRLGLHHPRSKADLDWWHQHLAGLEPLGVIPDLVPTGDGVDRGHVCHLRVDRTLTRGLQECARRQECTLFMVLAAVFAALLSRLTNDTDIALGTPVAGRDDADTHDLIGLFVNTLVLRIDLASEPSFETLVQRTREATLAAFEHRSTPYDELVARRQAEQEADPVRALLALEVPPAPPRLEGLEVSLDRVSTDTAKSDLGLTVTEVGGGLDLQLVTRADRFTRETTVHILQLFAALAGDAVRRPTAAVTALALLTQTERCELLHRRSQPPTSQDTEDAHASSGTKPEPLLHQLIAAQADRTPMAEAVVFWDAAPSRGSGRAGKHASRHALTYATLSRRARKLARHLAGLGVGPGSVVAVALERSPDLVITLTAVLEAGGAYLPLDPSYPAARLRAMVEDAQAAVLVTISQHLDLLVPSPARTETTKPELLCLDRDTTWQAQPSAPLEANVHADDLAYVIYTSGSTGKPKGVAISHRAVAERLAWVRQHDLDTTSAFLQKTTISFDVSVAEIFGPLVAGGRTVLPPPGAAQDTDLLLRLIEAEAITHTSFPPTLLSALLDEPGIARRTRSLRTVITGGETVPPDLPGRVAAQLPGVVIENRYGPTEATISVSAWRYAPGHLATPCTTGSRAAAGANRARLPIGQPIAGAAVYILDHHLEPVPVGVPGEILIGGSCLARCYLGRPAQTAAAFVPDPVSSRPGARLYRSGDLARWRHDGEIEFLGRRDAQIKLRGFRIELGEVEHALRSLPGVTQVAAAVRSVNDRSMLVGFLVGSPLRDAKNPHLDVSSHHDGNAVLDGESAFQSDTVLDVDDCAARLTTVLPDHMVPERFIVLDALPTAPTGKIDRRRLERLPLPDTADDPASRATKQAPRTRDEHWLVALFAEVLGLDDPPGIDQSFFHLGGHSLLATSLMARIRGRLNRDIPLRTLFDAPTPAALARALAVPAAPESSASHSPIEAASSNKPLLPPITAHQAAASRRLDQRTTRRARLTFGQERLWFLHQLEPTRATYHIATGLNLRGRLHVGALDRAIRALIERHASLRTTFIEEDGIPEQIIHPVPSPSEGTSSTSAAVLPLIDLSDLATAAGTDATGPAANVEYLLTRRLETLARTPFDLARGPLLRTTLIRLARDHHVLAVVMHHIVSDGWSVGILVHELSVLYRAFATAPAHARQRPSELSASALPDITLEVADVARWQQRHRADSELGTADLNRQLAYWRQQLEGAPAQLDLPVDFPRSGSRSGHGRTLEDGLDGALVTQVKAFSVCHDATIFMTLLAAFQALLQRISGQQDIVVGTPVAGRTRSELEPLVGFFVSTLALRTDFRDSPTFRDLLAQVRATTLDAYAHQDLPFEKLVERLDIERDLSSTPLFQVMFVLQNAPRATNNLGDLELTDIPIDTGTAKLDLTLTVVETAKRRPDESSAGMHIRLEYATDRFEAATAQRFLHQFEHLLAAAIASPDTPIQNLPWMDEAERARLIDPISFGPPLQPRHDTLNAWIESSFTRAPKRTALIAGGVELTYAELDIRVATLTQHLIQLGIAREDRIGICLGRSADMVVAMLAVHRAGAAYVPLDPAYPADRITFMVHDAHAVAVIVEPETDHAVSASPGLRRVVLGDLPAGPHVNPGPRREIWPDQLAYVIYTSGSTGHPKGVAISQGNAAALVAWAADRFEPKDTQRTLAATSINFDLSVFEIFATLAQGGTVLLAQDVLDLAQAMEEQAPTLLEAPTLINTVPSAAAELVEAARLPPSARIICLAGEPLHRNLVDALYAHPSVERVLNLYGPSEDTTYSTCADIPRSGGTSPIGRPLPGTSALVLDPALEVVPIGVPGELYLGGHGLARGYLGQPALTAERFVPHPFAATHGERLYRTGDLARRRNDGELLFLGRADQQVKLRGFRIELGEIESRLCTVDGVAEAAVIVHAPSPDNPQLIGFLTASHESSPGEPSNDGEAVRQALRRALPAHMVPSFLTWLPALPRLPNGKIDRRQLTFEAPQALLRQAGGKVPAGPVDGEDPISSPSTSTERRLAAIWKEVLGIAPLDRTDEFFALGGHSLLATRVVSRIRQHFQVDLPLRAVFDTPGLDALAHTIDERLATSQVTEMSASHSLGSDHRLSSLVPAIEPAPQPPVDDLTHDRTPDAQRALGPGVIDRAPLSLAQERLWFLHQLEPESGAYHIPAALRLRGTLHLDALRRAFAALAGRHSSLRTTFTTREGIAEQVVHDLSIALPVIDLSGVASRGSDREALADSIARTQARKPFDLGRGPLLRAAVIRLANDHHILAVTMHHIVSDGWSVGVMVRELSAFYRAFAAGTSVPVALAEPLAIQVTDHARWQRRHLVGDVLAQQLAYWRQQLAGAVPQLDLPTDFPRPARRSDRGGVVEIVIGAKHVASLERLAGQQGATLFMVLLAAFQAFLHRHTGERNILIGSPVAGRNRLELEPLIGFFVSTLVLRADLRDDPTFEDLLIQARNTVLDAQANQDVPFEKLVEELGVVRDLSSTPLFQVMLVLQNAPSGPLELGELAVEPLATTSASAAFDLTLTAIEVPEAVHTVSAAERGRSRKALRLQLEFSADLFTEQTARRMLARLATLLAAVAESAGQPVSVLPVMPPDEHEAIASWNRTQVDYDDDTLVTLLASQAARTPDHLALIFDDGPHDQATLTYGALWHRAGRLAETLVAHGIGPDHLVGLCAERSPELVIGLVAILRAGGAYLPLDPTYPADRIALMVDDGNATLALVQPHLRTRLPQERNLPDGFTIIPLDPEAGIAEDPDLTCTRDVDLRLVDPGHLAYTIFTSGSTGRPKGVMVPQRAVVNHLRWLQESDPLRGDDRMLQKTPTSFDASVFELFWPLTTGATLVLARPEGRKDGTYLADLIRRQRITVVTCVPSLLDALLDQPTFCACQHLRAVSCGGETLHPELVDRFHAAFPDRELVNFYGPTEATIEATAWPLARSAVGAPRAVPIGLPVANTEVQVLDANMRPVPLGVAGELLIGGDQLARGYLDRPGLTAARFLPHPDPRQPGERLYASGDRARWRAGDHAPERSQGWLEFLGRLDNQVKLRGHRIELGEIEHALLRHPHLREAAVVTDGDRLVAFVAPDTGIPTPEPDALVAHVATRLPDYMVPAAWVMLDALPVAPTGKVDRQALRMPDRAATASQGEPPRNAREQQVANAIAEVLELDAETLARDADFFAIGGHSLLATRLVAALHARFDVELPLVRLFEAPTAAGLAAEIETATAIKREVESHGAATAGESASRGPKSWEAAPPLRPRPLGQQPPLSFAQERLWFLDRLAPGSPWYNVPAAIRLDGQLDLAALQQALDKLVLRHEALRTVFPARAGQPSCQVHQPHTAEARVPLAVIDLSARDLPPAAGDAAREASRHRIDTRVAATASRLARHAFDLAVGPLLRVTLIRQAPAVHTLVLVLHHIVADEWSTGIMVRELAAGYREACLPGERTGHPSPAHRRDARADADPPALPIQLGDHAVWQRAWLRGDVLEGQLAYWREHLDGIPPRIDLATDKRDGWVGARGAQRARDLSVSTTSAVRAWGQARGTTLFMSFLAAWSAVLSRMSGQRTVVVGTPLANREQVATQGLIGFLVNTLPLRIDVDPWAGFGALVDQVRTVVLGAQRHQHVPFDRIVQEVATGRAPDHEPVFQVMLAMQTPGLDTPGQEPIRLPGLTLSPAPVALAVSKFEMTLSVTDHGDSIALRLAYQTDRFAAATADRVLDQVVRLLDSAVAAPDRPLAYDDALGTRARAQILGAWRHAPRLTHGGSTSHGEPGGRALRPLFLHQLVATQAASTPTAIAVVSVCGDDAANEVTARLTYQDLLRRARRLASHLRAQGVGPDQAVGVALGRSPALVPALLAVLEAGGAFLPLDPEEPAERMLFKLNDARASLLLTTADDQPIGADEWGHDAPGRRIVRVDRMTARVVDGAPAATSSSVDRPPTPRPTALTPALSPANLAYVIYTSGSTGHPKGVEVSHRAVAERLAWVADRELDSSCVFLQKTTISFDVSVAEIFAPLVAGGRTVLPPPGAAGDTDRLLHLIAAEGVTHTSFPPTLLAALLDEPDIATRTRSVQSIVTGGETVPPHLPGRVAERLGDVLLENRYGPTEATISVTAWPCQATLAHAPDSNASPNAGAGGMPALPIGRPIAGAEMYVLNAALEPVPIGAPGEIVIGGSCVARGYRGHPGRTAASFVPDPFAPTDGAPDHFGARLYRTGDLGRWRSDGALEFLGRRDGQVKIRGFRVELGEIEATLATLSGVREAAVVDVPAPGTPADATGGLVAGSGDRLLVAYLTSDALLDRAELRATAAQRLPRHQIPAAFVVLDQLPTSATGKVDRQALRQRGLPAHMTGHEPAPDGGLGGPARGATETGIAAIWAELLQTESIGRHDDFFARGGHSLLATRVMALLRDRFDIDLPLRAFFAAPTVAGLAAAVEARRRRSEGNAEAREDGAARLPPLIPIPRAADGLPPPAPLSPAQERLWFLDRLTPGSDLFNMPMVRRLRGKLDLAAFRTALETVVHRHEALRTTFTATDGPAGQSGPVQKVAAPTHLTLPLVDLRGPTRGDVETLARRLAQRECQRAFDLAKGPVLRAHLLRLTEDEHWLTLVVHHIVGDEWSMRVLARELATAYGNTLRAGTHQNASPPDELLPPITVHQGDVARWQRDGLQGNALRDQLTYWRTHLAGAPDELALITDRPRPAVETHAGATAQLWLPAQTRARLDRFAQRAGATRFMVFLAAFSALLSRHARQETVVIGTPIAHRDRNELQHVIGFLLNTVPLRLDLGDDPSFAELVSRARVALADAASHQALPFERLVQALAPRRNLARSPIFQAMLIVGRDDDSGEHLRLPGLAIEAIAPETATAKVELTLGVHPQGDGLRLGLEYNRDLFDPGTAERLLAHLRTLLDSALAAPDRPVRHLPLETATEETALRVRGAGPRLADVADDGLSSLPALFAQQARRSPTAEAVRDSTSSALRYDQLLARVEHLAARLVRAGVRVEDRVGIYLTRSNHLVIAGLAVLRSGGTYVPLDPAFPRERLLAIATDAGARLVVTERALLDTLPTGDAIPLLVDQPGDRPEVDDLDTLSASLPPLPDPGQAAYQIYTSGSTGLPKGVTVSHGALANFLRAMARQPGLKPDETLLAITTLSFDIAALELFLPLVVGARTVIASREEAIDGPRIAALLDAHAVDVLQATPATWRLLLTTGWQGRPGLRMLCGGEPLPADLATSLLATGPRPAPAGTSRRPRLWNLYGPTETTVWSTLAPVVAGETITIGRPILETDVRIVDADGRMTASGVPGELAIGGAGVARGYAGQPRLTAERFVPDAFGSKPGARLYRTGDLARWRSDGRLDCLGRIDHQLKIRGFRIEPGEIEAVLVAHPAIRQAVVVAQDHGQGDQRLVAFLVAANADASATAALPADLHEDLKVALQKRLPAYMMPAAFAFLDQLPLTPNAKIDRQALAQWTTTQLSTTQQSPPPAAGPGAAPPRQVSGAKPRTATERHIADIWRQVLGVDTVSIDDSFFELGGHSLLLAQVHTQLRGWLGDQTPLDMVELFRLPTIRALARHLDAACQDEPGKKGGRRERDTSTSSSMPPASLARRRAERGRSDAGGRDIAIVGMAGRFPGAPDIETLWQRLRAGDELLSHFDEQMLLEAGVTPELLASPDYIRVGAQLEDADCFDAAFFGYSPREAQIIDPQQRIFLECAWTALESAGYDPSRYPGRIGVFGGVGMNGYLLNLLAQPDLIDVVGPFQIMISNDKDYLPTRVSYKLGLTGPGVAIQTACSTSLVAISFACDALLEGRAEMILAGGVTVHPTAVKPTGYRYEAGGIQSPDGRTRSFDARSKGTVASSAAGIVLLKRLDDALADGDTIRAVIKGWAINNDGADKVGFTAPSVSGQAKVIREALTAADVDPGSIGYVEAHGTGTPLGDPIEVAALNRAFTAGPWTPRSCALGSIKSNLGHTDAAAGVCGVIKTVLALEHGEIPPSLFFETPNPQIDFAGGPFFVADQLQPWPRPKDRDGAPLPARAGVSAMGIGGTNAHIVLEQAPRPRDGDALPNAGSLPETAQPESPGEPELLIWSAATESGREATTTRLASYFSLPPEAHAPRASSTSLAAAAGTLQTGRRAFAYRRFTVAEGWHDAGRALVDPSRLVSKSADADDRPVVFLFPGSGAQYPNMGRGLYEQEPHYRDEIDRIAKPFAQRLGHDPRTVLYPGLIAGDETTFEDATRRLRRPSYGMPALFATELALARLWQSWGVAPAAVIGHSLGEYTAAVLAGVLSREEAVTLVAERGALFETLPEGAMLSVALGAEALECYVRGAREDDLAIAAANTPTLSVVSGSSAAIDDLAARLERDDIDTTRLHIDIAAHSPMVDRILERFAGVAETISAQAPTLPLISNVTGDWLRDDEARDVSYWPRHLRATVRFADGLATLLDAESPLGQPPVLLEVGPGHTLATLARQHPATARGETQGDVGDPNVGVAGIVSSLRPPARSHIRPAGDRRDLLEGLGRLWLAGAEIDWHRFGTRTRASDSDSTPRPRRVPLPTYSFERTRHWIDLPPGVTLTSPAGGSDRRRIHQDRPGQPAVLTSAATPTPHSPERPTAADGSTPTPPRDDLERTLHAIWQQLLGADSFGVFDDFFELGGSSLLAIRMRTQLSQALDHEIPPHLVLESATIASLATRLRQEGLASAQPNATEDDATPNLVPLQQGTQRPLFLVHPVGGHVFFYRDLARAVGPDWTVLGLRAQGTESDETPIDNLGDMAARYVEQVRIAQPVGPYRLGGSSMGGNVAFEMARQLHAAGERVELLALLDSVGPGEMPARPADDVGLFQFLLRDQLPLAAEALRAMDAEERIHAVLDAAKRQGMLPPDLGRADLARTLNMVRAHLAALFDHAYRRHDGPLLYFRAADRRPGDPPHPELSWIDLAGGGIEIHVVTGDHISMHAPPHLGGLAARLRTALRGLS